MNEEQTGKVVIEDLDPSFRDEIASMPGGENIKKCFACGTCAAGCPVTGVDEEYNCRKIIRQVLFGMREQVLKSITQRALADLELVFTTRALFSISTNGQRALFLHSV